MDYKVFFLEYNNYTFKIEEDNPEVGVYLYVFKNDKCIKDYLQNTVQDCKEIALEDYGVPIKEWESKINP
ncbi:MAG: hypothetical protein GY830_10405 [Bacteroidetes bacterium]|nr:hypothetical protein [Bacteroidota bacterium]